MACSPAVTPKTPPTRAIAVAHAGLALSSLCWAVAFIAGKFALAEMTPLVVGAWRYSVAALVLLPFAVRARERADLRSHALGLVVLIACGGVLYPWLFLLALERTSATNTALLIALNPALTMLLSPLVGERLDRPRIAGLALAFLGAIIVITEGTPAHLMAIAREPLRQGDVLAVVAASSWAAFNLASRRAVTGMPPAVINCLVYGGGCVALFALAQAEHPTAQLAAATPRAIGAVVAMALLSSVLAGQLFLIGIATVGVNRTVVFVYLVPVLTALLSTMILGEALHGSQAIGGAAVLAGVYWTTRAAVGAPSAPSPLRVTSVARPSPRPP